MPTFFIGFLLLYVSLNFYLKELLHRRANFSKNCLVALQYYFFNKETLQLYGMSPSAFITFGSHIYEYA